MKNTDDNRKFKRKTEQSHPTNPDQVKTNKDFDVNSDTIKEQQKNN